MPIIKSAKKRVRQSARRRARNVVLKKKLRQAIKTFESALENKKKADATKAFNELVSLIDISVKKKQMHKNKAARMKSKLSGKLSKTFVTPSKKTQVNKTKE